MTTTEKDCVDLGKNDVPGGVSTAEQRFRLRIDDARYFIDDPKPTGRQLLKLTPQRPVDERLIFLILQGGGFEEIRLDEIVDLTRQGIERFITFESSASYRLVVDGERIEWGAPLISGRKLKELANVDPDTYALWQEFRGSEDQPIADETLVDLRDDQLERFFTVIEQTTAGEAVSILPSRDRDYLTDHGFAFEEASHGAQHGVVLKGHGLPTDKLSEECADVLILLPAGYPDVPPDMFYCTPWLRVIERDEYPNCADQSFSFNGVNWQRWSRHSQHWRPGKDGIWTMLRRVNRALTEAA